MDHSENSSACEFVNFLGYSHLIINPGKHFGLSTKGDESADWCSAIHEFSSQVNKSFRSVL